MKRVVLGALLLIAGMYARAEMKQALTLHLSDGSAIVYLLEKEPVVTFASQQMSVAMEGEEEPSVIPMEDVMRWEIGMVDVSGIESVVSEPAGITLAVNGSDVTVYNPVGAVIAVYDMSGRMVGSGSQPEVRITLPRGIYVVTNSRSNNSIKFAVR